MSIGKPPPVTGVAKSRTGEARGDPKGAPEGAPVRPSGKGQQASGDKRAGPQGRS
jgi:hypothetical protein